MSKAIEQAVEDLTKITSTIDRVVVDIKSDTLVAAPVKHILEMITSRINASIQALQAEPQDVDVEDFPLIDPNLFAVYLGQMKIGKKIDKLMIERFSGCFQIISDQYELTYNTPAQTQPEPKDGLDEALLCGKHPQQAQQFKAKYGKPYYDVVRDAAKAYAELTKGKE